MGKKLLVADDSLTIQKIIKLALSNDGYEIQTVSDGNDAIQQISLFRPDIVLLDVSLPGKTAFEVKTLVDAEGDTPLMKFILMSSAFEKIDENLCAKVGFHGRLTKPFDPPQLRQVLSSVVAIATANPMSSILDNEAPSESPDLLWDLPRNTGSQSLEPQIDETFLNLSPPPLPGQKQDFGFPEGLPTGNETTDSDIKHLTESTVKMSGLGDFDWNISETARKAPEKAPDPIPEPGLSKNFFHLEPPAEDLISMVELEKDDTATINMNTAQPQGVMMTDSQIEKIVQSRLEKMAQTIIPEIAERIIKQEIRKMLQDPL